MRRIHPLMVVVCMFLSIPSASAMTAQSDALSTSVTVLPFRVKDAEFSTSLNAIIAVRVTPYQLTAYYPDTGVSYDVNLPLGATCVGVSPDGTRAAVGHNGWFSEINLTTMTLIQTVAVGVNVTDIIHGGNGFAYVFSTDGYVRSINLTTGASTSTYSWRTPAAARLHPSGDRIYGADRYVSPDDVIRFDIKSGQATYAYDSVYHGDFAFCGNVWISADGLRLYTACGNTFRAAASADLDIRYGGKLSQESSIQWVAHDLQSNRVAVLPTSTSGAGEIHYYAHDSLLYTGKAVLPSFISEGKTSASRGRWIFFNADGSRQYIVVQADASSGIVSDYGLLTVDCGSVQISVTPASATIGAAGGTLSFDVTGSTGCGWTTTVSDGWLDSKSTGVGNGKVAVSVKANDTTSQRSGTLHVGDQTITITQDAATQPGPVTIPALLPLPFRVIDAEYSPTLDAIVAVADDPYALRIFRIPAQTLTTVLLEHPATSVSVSPDGNYAAVGHDGFISYVNLVDGVLVKTLNVSTDVLDIVLAGNGYVYAFPRRDQWQTLRCVNIATNTETQHTGNQLYAGTVGRLHPGGSWIYAADNGLSPSDIEKYDTTGGTARYVSDSPYHGNYAMCGNVWFSDDGTRIYTPCGNVFRSTGDSTTDMRYVGAFDRDTRIRWAAHSTAFGSVAILPSYQGGYGAPPRTDQEIHYYTPDFLTFQGSSLLPSMNNGGTAWQTRGRWHFFSPDGVRQHTIVQADASSGILYDYAIATIDCTNAAVTPSPASFSIGAAGETLQIAITGKSGCGWKASATAQWLNTLTTGVGNGTVYVTVMPNASTSPRTGSVTIGGASVTITQAGAAITGFNAVGTSPTSVLLTWSFPVTADHFEIWRSAGGGFSMIGTTASLTFTDSGPGPNSAVIYRVRAVLTGNALTGFATDYAHTFTLTDSTLAGMPIRAVHITELRIIVNALLAAAGTAASEFTDPALVGVTAKIIHVTELRSAINRLRTALGLPGAIFSDPAAPNFIRAPATQELRTALQ